MAILIADGFDFYANTTDFTYVGSPWASPANALSATTPYGTGQSADISNMLSTPMISNQFATNEATIYLTFDVYPQSPFTGTNVQGFCATLSDVANNQVTLHWAQDGNFYVRSGAYNGTIIAGPWAHGMAPTSWCNWQAQVVINNTTGSVILRKNNNPSNDISFTGLNTRGGSTNNYANKVTIGYVGYGSYIDNIFCNSASGAAPTSWPGQVRAVQLMPNADTATKAMTPSTGTANYSMVNELIENGDTNYVFGSVAGNVDLYSITPLATVPAAIVAVATKNLMRKSDTGARTATTEIKSGSLVQDQATINLATTYQWQTVYFPTDPNTGAAWTFAGVNALLVGPKVVA